MAEPLLPTPSTGTRFRPSLHRDSLKTCLASFAGYAVVPYPVTPPLNIMKKIFICLLCSLLFFSCKEKIALAQTEKAPQKLSEITRSALSTPNPEIDKLRRVFALMSERAKDAIPNGNPEEFLSDLHKVLDEESKNHRNDDLDLLYLIDKKHSVSSDYVPRDLKAVKNNELWNVSRNDLSLRPESYASLEELSRAALADGIKLMVSSTYRSYKYQEGLFNRYVKEDGLELAERYSARPGTSQHQLGTAVDFGSITDDWGDTIMGKWVYNHASEYGWSLSFPQDYEDVTGYMWECWHFRYIGKEACRFQKKWFSNIQQFMLEFIDFWKRDKPTA